MATPAQPTKQQWEEVKQRLLVPYGELHLRCDGYLVAAYVRSEKMKLYIMVYVNGWIKGQWNWYGKESEIGQMGEIARRFYCLKSVGHPAKTIAKLEKIYGKRECKKKGIYDRQCYTRAHFNTPGAFISHIKKHNQSIEIIDSITHDEALLALEKEAEPEADSA